MNKVGRFSKSELMTAVLNCMTPDKDMTLKSIQRAYTETLTGLDIPKTNHDKARVCHALSRLVRDGDVVKVDHGIYVAKK